MSNTVVDETKNSNHDTVQIRQKDRKRTKMLTKTNDMSCPNLVVVNELTDTCKKKTNIDVHRIARTEQIQTD